MSLAVMIVLASSWGHRPTITTRRLRSNMPGLKASAITEDGLRCSPIFALSDSSLKRMIVSQSYFGPSFRYCSSVGSASALDLDE